MINSILSIVPLLSCYLIAINLIAFSAMGLDKYKAKKRHWRIPEQTLLFLAVIGGVMGCYIGMRFFRHKTRKRKFSLGLLPILLAWVILLYLIFYI